MWLCGCVFVAVGWLVGAARGGEGARVGVERRTSQGAGQPARTPARHTRSRLMGGCAYNHSPRSPNTHAVPCPLGEGQRFVVFGGRGWSIPSIASIT